MHLLKHFKELTVRPKNTQELKGLILQLAIQGKLTANWRKLNNEVELDIEKLKEISKKSLDFLINESNSIDELEVPSTWLKLKFKTLFEMQGGSQPPKSMFSATEREGYIQLYQIRDFGKRPVPVYVPTESVSKLCTEEDILIGRYGASIGKIFYGKKGAYNVALVRLIWNRDIIEQNFVYQIFSSYYMQEFFKNCTRSAQAGFNKNDMGKLNIPIPPLQEQKAIVEVVETLFKEVEQLEQLTIERISLKEKFVTSALNQLTTNNAKNEWAFLQEHFHSFFNETANIKKLRETVLQLAVQGKLTSTWRATHPELVSGSNSAKELLKHIQKEKAQLIKDKKIKKEKPLPPFTKEDIPYELPKGWVWCRLGDYLLCERGKFSARPRNDPQFFNGPFPFIQIGSLNKDGGFINDHEQSLNEKGLKVSKLFPKGTIAIAIVGATIGGTGILGYDMCFPDSLVGIKPSSNFDSNYIEYFLRSKKLEFREISYAGGGQPNIKLPTLNEALFPLPNLKEQKAIVQKVNALIGLCDALEQEVQQNQEQSEKLMKSVLREVFDGKKELETV